MKLKLTLVVCLFLLNGLFFQEPSPSLAEDSFEFVFATGFDQGPIGDGTMYGLEVSNDHPATGRLEWQTAVKRTGEGAYHGVGGNISSGDLDIINTRDNPFGGLEVWMGGAFYFTSFPEAGLKPTWLMALVPTDGEVGADDKPIAAITPGGKIQLTNSNNRDNATESNQLLSLNKWYYLLMHGINDGCHGDNAPHSQQLFLYDGDSGALLEILKLTMAVNGKYSNKVAKWGFGTSTDSTGLEYYLDDIFFGRGNLPAGAIRVFPKKPIETSNTMGFAAIGAQAPHLTVNESPVDGDNSYLTNNTQDKFNQIELDLSPIELKDQDFIYAVQALIVAKQVNTKSEVGAGLKIGGLEALSPIKISDNYVVRPIATYSIDPATNTTWQPNEINTFKGVIKGIGHAKSKGTSSEIRVTNIWYNVVYAQRTPDPSEPTETVVESTEQAPIDDPSPSTGNPEELQEISKSCPFDSNDDNKQDIQDVLVTSYSTFDILAGFQSLVGVLTDWGQCP